MKRIKKNIKELKVFFINLFKTIRLLFMSSKSMTSAILLINILIGVGLPLQLIIWKNFIDLVNEMITYKTLELTDSLIWLVLHFTIAIFTRLLYGISNYLEKMLADYMNKEISNLVMDKISLLELRYFDDPKSYDNIAKVNNESVSRSMNILSTFSSFTRTLTTLFGSITIFMLFKPLIILLAFISTVPIFLINTKISIKQFNLYNARFEKLRLVLYLKAIFIKYDYIKEMKIYRVGKYFKNQIVNTYDEYINEDKTIRKKFLRDLTVTDFLQTFVSYGFKIYILLLVLENNYSIGELTMYITAIESFQSSMSLILSSYSSLYIDILYMDNLFSFISISTDEIDKNEKVPFDGKFKVIEFVNVSFTYPGSAKPTLKNINIKIKNGMIYSIVGLNGSGKTTLIKLLLKLYKPDQGFIYIDGIDIGIYNTESLYKKIGVVFQDFIKFPLTVNKNIGLGNLDHIDDELAIISSAEKSGADNFIQKLPNKYNTVLQKEWTGGTDLSLGQWQKLAISRLFMADSSILVLDEPTASLDAVAEYEVFKSFKEISSGKTCVLISHRFSTVKLADEIIVIKEGEIIETGSHDQLITMNAEYAKLYNLQAESYVNDVMSKAY